MTAPLQNDDQIKECSYCLEDLEDNIKTLEDCEHEFHSDCIKKWFKRCDENQPVGTNNITDRTCPLCRSIVLRNGKGLERKINRLFMFATSKHYIYKKSFKTNILRILRLALSKLDQEQMPLSSKTHVFHNANPKEYATWSECLRRIIDKHAARIEHIEDAEGMDPTDYDIDDDNLSVETIDMARETPSPLLRSDSSLQSHHFSCCITQ